MLLLNRLPTVFLVEVFSLWIEEKEIAKVDRKGPQEEPPEAHPPEIEGAEQACPQV